MIVFHSNQDKNSRNFINEIGDDNLIINWYDKQVQKKYELVYGRPEIRTFPAVFLFLPSFKTEPIYTIDGDIAHPSEIVDAYIRTIYPDDMADLLTTIADVNTYLQISRDLGYPVDDISIQSISAHDEEYRLNIYG